MLKRNTNGSFFTLLIVAMLLAFYSPKAKAQGNLMIIPKRVVFESQKKSQELSLANTGKDTARYLISLMEIRMKNDGSFEQITLPDSGQNFASSNVRIFPRSVKLGPGEAQTIKVQVTKQSQLMAGEYRSHIYFRAVPDEKPLGEKNILKDTSNLSVQLTPVFGISIPLIIRVGESNSVITISGTKLKKIENIPVLDMVFNRTGSMSVYGDLSIEFISATGKVTEVARANGLAVYTPTTSRSIRMMLDTTANINYRSGKLHVVFNTTKEAKSIKIAETELALF